MLDKTGSFVDGSIDSTVESMEDDKVITNILTIFPEEEILYYIPVGGYLNGRTVNSVISLQIGKTQ